MNSTEATRTLLFNVLNNDTSITYQLVFAGANVDEVFLTLNSISLKMLQCLCENGLNVKSDNIVEHLYNICDLDTYNWWMDDYHPYLEDVKEDSSVTDQGSSVMDASLIPSSYHSMEPST